MAGGFLASSKSAWHIICAQEYVSNEGNESKKEKRKDGNEK